MIELTARKLINSGFLDLYKKLLLDLDIDEEEKIKVLAVAVVLINQVDDNLNNLGYRIALAYGNKIRSVDKQGVDACSFCYPSKIRRSGGKFFC
jgi:hypothetical protein